MNQTETTSAANGPAAESADPRIDRLFALLPSVIRDSDAFVGRPLQALLRVMAEQANIVEDDIEALHDNAFVETCDEWVLPFLGELVGYHLVPENGNPQPDDTPRGRARLRAIYPRGEIAHLVRTRRRKGILLLLEQLAHETTGWSARAVEFRTLIAAAWNARHPQLRRGINLDLRAGDLLERGFGPFDVLSRRIDVRRMASRRTAGRGNLHAVGLWIWRLKIQRIQRGQARHVMERVRQSHHHPRHSDYRLERYFLNPFGVDQPLFTQPTPTPEPTEAAHETEVPAAIRIQAMRRHLEQYYGPEASIYLQHGLAHADPVGIAADYLEIHDLSAWEQSLPMDHPFLSDDPCAIHAVLDPTRGRVLYRRHRSSGEQTLWSRHHTAFSAHIGGGGYSRHLLPTPTDAEIWRIGDKDFPDLMTALERWGTLGAAAKKQPSSARPRRVVIEFDDDAIHRIGELEVESYRTEIGAGECLILRAVSGRRPVIRHVRATSDDYRDWTIDADTTASNGGPPMFALDGIQLAETPLQIHGAFAQVRLRHITLFAADHGNGEALLLEHFDGCLSIEQSILLGAIHVRPEPIPAEACVNPPAKKRHGKVVQHAPPTDVELMPPARLLVVDSILDGWDCDDHVCVAGWPRHGAATHRHSIGFVTLTMLRSTVFGHLAVSGLNLAEDCIFEGSLRVANTGQGCMRFCAIGVEDAIAKNPVTPPRYECQPDLEIGALRKRTSQPTDNEQRAAARGVTPRFTSEHYGDPGYAQLACHCSQAIVRGASDEAEMGVFHDLYQPQKEAILRARLAEFTLADADAMLLFAN